MTVPTISSDLPVTLPPCIVRSPCTICNPSPSPSRERCTAVIRAERLEQMRKHLGRNRAAIGDLQTHGLDRVAIHLDADIAARRAMMQCIAHQIRHRLPDQIRIPRAR